MGGYFGNAGVFLITTVFGFYITVLLLRALLQLARANFFNPVCQFLVKITNPPLVPLRKIVPNWGRWDLAALLLAWLLKIVSLVIVLTIIGRDVGLGRIAAVSAVQLLDLVVIIFMAVIFIKVILSWVAPQGDNPVVPLLYQLSEPVLGPARRLLPPIGGLDLSPMIALLVLQLVRLLLIQPLMDLTARI